MDFVLELIGRYFLTGIILWGFAFIMMVIRLAYKSLKTTPDGLKLIDELQEDTEKAKKIGVFGAIIRLVIWPYGIVKVIDIYMKTETKLIAKLHKDES